MFFCSGILSESSLAFFLLDESKFSLQTGTKSFYPTCASSACVLQQCTSGDWIQSDALPASREVKKRVQDRRCALYAGGSMATDAVVALAAFTPTEFP